MPKRALPEGSEPALPKREDASLADSRPAHQRPELPDFWDHRFRSRTTPWEAGEAPRVLREFAADYTAGMTRGESGLCTSEAASRPPRVLIPGCGSAHDAAFLDRQGWSVTALDFSAAAVEQARNTVDAAWRGTLLCADFFAFTAENEFDVIYERAFLCALPRHLWPAYGQRVAQLLRPGGLLAGFFFFSEEAKGPPFGLLPRQLDALLQPELVRIAERPIDDSLPVFAGHEYWQIWQRR